MRTEDHPVDYGSFEGVIPEGEYGGGTVMLWDRGTWEPVGDPRAGLAKGKLEFVLHGEKLHGRWTLVKIRGRASRDADKAWLLIKGRDEAVRAAADYDVTGALPESVTTRRSMDEIAGERDRVWHSNQPAKQPGRVRATPAATVSRRAAPTVPSGARRASLPAFIAPQLATLVSAAPAGDEWLHEMKFDGYRVLCRIERGSVQLLSRNGSDWTGRLPGIARAASAPRRAVGDARRRGRDRHAERCDQLQRVAERARRRRGRRRRLLRLRSAVPRWPRPHRDSARRAQGGTARAARVPATPNPRCATAIMWRETARRSCGRRAACRSREWSRSVATRRTSRVAAGAG